jgi:hypothetical protein
MHAQNSKIGSGFDQFRSGKQYKKPTKSTDHSSQHTHEGCTSSTFLKMKQVSMENAGESARTTAAAEPANYSQVAAYPAPHVLQIK